MNRIWQKAPVFRVLFPFVAGIIAGWELPLPSVGENLLFAAACTVLCAFSILAGNRLHFRHRWLTGMLFSCAFLFTGVCFVQQARQTEAPDFFAKRLKENDILQLRLLEPLQEKDNYFKTSAEVSLVCHSNSAEKVCGKVLLYFSKDRVPPLHYGDVITITNKIQALRPPQNPDEFDFSRYMAAFNIYHSAYLSSRDWHATGRRNVNPLWQFAYYAREKVNANIAKALPDLEQAGIAKALITGDVSDVTPYLQASYAGTGTLHVLSVSGLHVGFIFWLLALLLGFMDKGSKRRILRMLLMVSLLWLYALFTGLSPAVCRSAFMFSFVLIGKDLRRESNVYNSIFTSALFLLMLDPLVLFQVGFQMSYIALLAIVWLQPGIEKIWQPANRWLQKLWKACSVSLAAQAGTFVLGLYYFNQFPVYFLPANLIIVPLSVGCLIAGLAFLGLSPFNLPIIQFIAARLLYYPVWLLNKVAVFFNHMPAAHWDGIFLESYEAVLLYLFILLAGLALLHRDKRWLIPALSIAVLFTGIRIGREYQSYRHPELRVMAIARHNVIAIRLKNQLAVLGDTDFLASADQMKYHITRYAFHNFIAASAIHKVSIQSDKSLSDGAFYYRKPLCRFCDKRLLIITSPNDLDKLDSTKAFDVLILGNSPKLSLADIYRAAHFKTVVASANNSAGRIAGWQTEAIENGIPFYNLQKDNSFAIRL